VKRALGDSLSTQLALVSMEYEDCMLSVWCVLEVDAHVICDKGQEEKVRKGKETKGRKVIEEDREVRKLL